jgi:hypothetical protein
VQLDQLTVRAPGRRKDSAGEQSHGRIPVQRGRHRAGAGHTDSLLVRVDVDEINASHVRPGCTAIAALKADSSRRFPLQFVRIVP